MTAIRPAGRKSGRPAAAEESGAEAGGEAGVNFEKAMQRLETIVGDMESGALSLEDMIARFEEGQRLIGVCGRKLNEVQRKVEMLVKKGDDVLAEPFDETAAAEEDAVARDKKEELF